MPEVEAAEAPEPKEGELPTLVLSVEAEGEWLLLSVAPEEDEPPLVAPPLVVLEVDRELLAIGVDEPELPTFIVGDAPELEARELEPELLAAGEQARGR